jgi:hypothetical protein
MHSSSVVSAAGLCLATVGAAAPVHAFCRTTTSPVPSGYDPVVNGCWTHGTPLAWKISRVPIGVISAAGSQVSLADATRVENLVLATWNHVSCSGQSPSIQAYDDGPIAHVPQGGCTGDSCEAAADDYIAFDDSAWPYDSANNLALTTVTFGLDDGRIFGAHIEVNTAQHQIVAEEPPPPGTYDLQAILTHETGHFFGLGKSNETSAVMYPYYRAGAIDLTPDDEAGLCSIYPPATSQSGGGRVSSRCAVHALRADDEPLGVVGSALVIVGSLVTRRRTTRSARGSRS